MLYGTIKILAKIAIKLYCRHIDLNKKALLQLKGPVLLAANHPDSFLDAIILCTLFDQPIYSLARGDAFKNKLYAKVLFKLKMLPVYRVTEGVENLEENYKTFDLCKEIFKKNGIVLIFSEGKCINEWHLRPLMKGTARLAISSWEEGIPLKVLPVGINYSSFGKFSKNVKLFFGDFISAKDITTGEGHGKAIQSFNNNLSQQLQPFVFEIDKNDSVGLHQAFYEPQSFLKKVLLFTPSIVGWLFHVPLFYPVRNYVRQHPIEKEHYDSIVVAILLLAYPIYLLVIAGFVFGFTHCWVSFLLLLILPFTAWAHVQLRKQIF